MTDLKYDPEFPFVAIDKWETGNALGRFPTRQMAESTIELRGGSYYWEVIDTTPTPLPQGHGATVVVPGKMPLVRMYEYWIMPMETSRRSADGSHPLCTPLDYGKYYLTDDDVRKLIAAAGGKYTAVEGSNG